MGREIRRVPADWEHPKDEHGNYIPMYDQSYDEALAEYNAELEAWNNNTHPDILNDPKVKVTYPNFKDWKAGPPDKNTYRSRIFKEEELTHIQLYNTTSEGEPISPLFKADEFEKLCEWAAENATTFADYKAPKDSWIKMLKDGYVYHKAGNITYC